jgi:Tol biopolymer transport system component
METTAGRRTDFVSGEAVEGEILAVKLERDPISPEEALGWALEVGATLARAHSQGMVHGKVSPQCILIGANGAATLLRPLPGEEPVYAYRAPEQILGKPADARSDIFAYGALLYQLAAGEPAFEGEGTTLNAAILEDDPPPIGSKSPIHLAMEKVIAGCLIKDPAKRRQRMQNALTELKLTARTLTKAEMPAERRSPPRHPRPADAPRDELDALPNLDGLAEPAFPEGETETAAERPWQRRLRPAGRQYYQRGMFSPQRKRFTPRMWMIVGASLALLVVAAGVMAMLSGRNAPSVYRFSIDPEDAKYPGMPAVSPDGRTLAYSATGPEGKRVLWIRELDGTHAKSILNTDGAAAPFWSPDSSNIGFFSGGYLKRIRIQDGNPSGAPATICPVDSFSGGGAWNRDGTILFAPSLTDGLMRVNIGGGTPQAVTKLDYAKKESAHLWPQFLPDGKHFIFFVGAESSETTGVYAGSLDSPKYTLLFSGETNAIFSSTSGSSGYLLYMRNGALIGQPFNASKLATTGDSMTLATNMEPVESLRLAQISASNNGTLVYQSAGRSTRQLAWLDRSGKSLGLLGEPADWGPPRISPDGKHVAVGRKDEKSSQPVLWILNAADGSADRLTHMRGASAQPVWSPDGSRVGFSNDDLGRFNLYVQGANGQATAEPVYRSGNAKFFDDWSRDGRFLLFDEIIPGMNHGLYLLNLGDRRATAIIDTIHSEGYGTLSPDGKWLAYQSDETGINEVVVQAFDGAEKGTKKLYTISHGGGGLPKWRRDGKELFYITQPGKVFAVNVHPTNNEFAFDPPKELFHTRPTPRSWNLYDVAPDGERFLLNTPMDWPSGSKIVVITAWQNELK